MKYRLSILLLSFCSPFFFLSLAYSDSMHDKHDLTITLQYSGFKHHVVILNTRNPRETLLDWNTDDLGFIQPNVISIQIDRESTGKAYKVTKNGSLLTMIDSDKSTLFFDISIDDYTRFSVAIDTIICPQYWLIDIGESEVHTVIQSCTPIHLE